MDRSWELHQCLTPADTLLKPSAISLSLCVSECVWLTLNGQHGSQLSVQQFKAPLQIMLFLPVASWGEEKTQGVSDNKLHQYVND